MIPVARALRDMDQNVIIGSGDEHLSFFRNELPGLTYVEFPGFRPRYSRLFPQYFALLLKTPNLLYHIIREHIRLKRIIKEHSIDIVISDNRFGLWNRNVKTVYVTHMTLIPFPKPFRFLEFIGIMLHRAVIKRYSFCFIPDLPGKLNVSGRLSHGMKLHANVRYIGILSRFVPQNSSVLSSVKSDHNTVILSGPEPQRDILKQKLIFLLKNKKPDTIMFEGRPGIRKERNRSGYITFYNHLPATEMLEIIKESKSVITRSGYTTIMELIALNCSALLIPTPGQTEQEYLAEYLSEKGWFSTISQSELNGDVTLRPVSAIWPGKIIEESRILLITALKELLEYEHR